MSTPLRKLDFLKPPWQPGQSGNPAGRPKGSRNKLTEAFLQALHEDFEQHGASVIQVTRLSEPAAYLKIVASLCPRELDVKRPLEDMDDAELRAAIDALQRFVAIGPLDGSASGGGSETTQ